MGNWNIRVKTTDRDNLTVAASYNGKAVDLTDKTTVCNVAGLLAQVSCTMVSQLKKGKENDK